MHGALLKLGIHIGESSLSKYLRFFADHAAKKWPLRGSPKQALTSSEWCVLTQESL